MKKPAQWNFTPLNGVKRTIAIASGKGGVGKSTVTVMMAHYFAAKGQRVGILDADIYGPSIPRMLDLKGRPQVQDKTMTPLQQYGIYCNSMGFLVEDESALVWRGPMITKALNQLARTTKWDADGALDLLLVDMPPGTGDVHLSMAQQVPLDGVIIVTTPQQVAVQDAQKCVDMFNRVNISILGILENMSWFASDDGTRQEIFGAGGGAELATKAGCPLLGQIPLQPALGTKLDIGQAPEKPTLQTFQQAAEKILSTIN